MLAFNFFFLPPLYTFTLADRQNWVALAVYLVTAIVVGELAVALRGRRERRPSSGSARRRCSPTSPPSSLAAHGTRARSSAASRSGRRRCSASRPCESSSATAARAPPTRRRTRSSVGRPAVGTLFTPETEEPRPRRPAAPPAGARVAARRRPRAGALAREALEADALRRSDTVKTAVIQAVSHDLRTPLATIEQALDGLESGELALTDDDRAAAARDDSRRARAPQAARREPPRPLAAPGAGRRREAGALDGRRAGRAGARRARRSRRAST